MLLSKQITDPKHREPCGALRAQFSHKTLSPNPESSAYFESITETSGNVSSFCVFSVLVKGSVSRSPGMGCNHELWRTQRFLFWKGLLMPSQAGVPRVSAPTGYLSQWCRPHIRNRHVTLLSFWTKWSSPSPGQDLELLEVFWVPQYPIQSSLGNLVMSPNLTT